MRPTLLRQQKPDIFNNLFKPSCANCLYFFREPTSLHNPEKIVLSTCKKFIEKPKIKQFANGFEVNYSIKNPYALLARFENNMCGIDGSSFRPKR
jgi:hypothetical protein